MPRLQKIGPEQATGKTREIYDGLIGKMGKVINIFQGMGNSAAVLQAYLNIGGALDAGELSAGEREVIALAISRANDCAYCEAAHTVIAGMAGIDGDEALNIRKGRASDPKHAALAAFALAVQNTRGYVSDEQLAAIRAAGYGDGAITEAVLVVAQTLFTNFFNHVNETEIDFPDVPAV